MCFFNLINTIENNKINSIVSLNIYHKQYRLKEVDKNIRKMSITKLTKSKNETRNRLLNVSKYQPNVLVIPTFLSKNRKINPVKPMAIDQFSC